MKPYEIVAVQYARTADGSLAIGASVRFRRGNDFWQSGILKVFASNRRLPHGRIPGLQLVVDLPDGWHFAIDVPDDAAGEVRAAWLKADAASITADLRAIHEDDHAHLLDITQPKTYKCADPACPGRPYRASQIAHRGCQR